MNRLILVGNGLDLAHGLKSSYKDFIFWYLDSCFNNAGIYVTTFFEDDFVYIKVLDHHRLMSLLQNSKEQGICNYLYQRGTLNRYLDPVYNNLATRSTPEQSTLYYEIKNTIAHTIVFKSDFFKHLIFCCIENNWVDIENEYYDQLKDCKAKDNSFSKEKVKKLNGEFNYLKKKLEEYLKLQQEQTNINVIPELLKIVKSDFEISDFDSIMPNAEARQKIEENWIIDPQIKHDLYFLNFNYTSTLLNYKEELDKSAGKFNTVKINQIHGELNCDDNHIIFGFGDEHDKQYLEFEEHNNKELFDHIKSYQYLRTPNYRNLLRFLNSDDYQVFVMGHSCGLSDRTMFKEIFEHENCKSIRLFHYNGDFHDKAINVSRHFSNKGLMRKLIVNYKASDAFPQSTINIEA